MWLGRGQEQETAMTKLKKLVTTALVLVYYDPTKELTIQCGVSSTGLDSALMQEGKPLAYASRALSDTEVDYAQIEKECLATVFSLERFHQYYFGRETVVHTDHKSLETIVKKHKAPKRIQGMLLRLLQYDIEVTSRGDARCWCFISSIPHWPQISDKDSSFKSTLSSICQSDKQRWKNSWSNWHRHNDANIQRDDIELLARKQS